MEKATVSRATLGRLPLYLETLEQLRQDGRRNVSATVLAQILNLGEVQVRKDLNAVCSDGRPKVGYEITRLIDCIRILLGRDKKTDVIVMGAGKMGMALLDCNDFAEYGISVIAAFDTDPSVRGTSPTGKPILPPDFAKQLCKNGNIRLAILTVPADAAQSACDLLCDCGITAIWNFTPVTLKVPESVTVRNENLALSLAHLNQKDSNTTR